MPYTDKRKGSLFVSRRRRKIKEILVAERGGMCMDCGMSYPPYMFDFDHRHPEHKTFELSARGRTKGIDRLREEAAKCDLVCANCHRQRTHKQRCAGCHYCAPVAIAA